MSNSNFIGIISSFSYYLIEENQNFNDINILNVEQKTIVTDIYSVKSRSYLIIFLDKVMIIILKQNLFKIKQFFDGCNELTIFCLKPEVKQLFISGNDINLSDKNIIFKSLYDNDFFNQATNKFNEHFRILNKEIIDFWKIIQNCFSSYLIQKSLNDSRFDRIKNCQKIINSKSEEIKISQHGYIILSQVGTGTASVVYMTYSIKDQKIYALKCPLNDTYEDDNLYNREIQNYQKIHHPFICNFYGTTKNKSIKYLILEYVDGILLANLKEKKLNITDKIKIIFEIMIIIEYLHNNKLVYRDLKPSNFMLNQDNDVILIDFDRMRNEQENSKLEFTGDFGHSYVAPEIINNGKFSCKSDIFSFGRLVYFIIFEKDIKNKNDFKQFPSELSGFEEMCKKCIQDEPNKRPQISELIDWFYINCFQNLNENLRELKTIQTNKDIHSNKFFPYWVYIATNQNSYSLYNLGKIYLDGKIIDQDIDQAIHYFSLAAEKKNADAISQFGVIHVKPEFGRQDIRKAIHYFTIAAEMNHPHSQYCLGILYSHEKFGQFDISKAIHYYTLASNQNYSNAQLNLGLIFFEKKYFVHNMNKAIKYLFQAANNNNPIALSNLGQLYFSGFGIEKNIKKGLYYLELSAKQNCAEALLVLGKIYYSNKNLKDENKAIRYLLRAADNKHIEALNKLGSIYLENKDINKAIHYFSLAADLNDDFAQNSLGDIFFSGEYIEQNINKAIHYYELSAKQNNARSQYQLGTIYYFGIGVPNDNEKSIHYLTLAAEQNDLEAQVSLGYIFQKVHDIKKSIYFYTLAANQNDPSAQNIVGAYLMQYDSEKGLEYLKRSANQNYSSAQFNLGYFYHESNLVRHDINKAIHYYTLAANNNHPQALYALGMIYCESNEVPYDFQKALVYLTLSADLGFPDSEIYLGCQYFEGQKVKQDINKAIQYFSLAAKNDHPLGYYNLGMYYFENKYTKQNIQKAIYYFELAAIKKYPYALSILGYIYNEDKYNIKNVDKSIEYYKRASLLGDDFAQFNLALIYLEKHDINNFLYYLTLSSEKNIEAQYILGYINFEGVFVNANYEKAACLFKNPSSFNHQYAKNNLALMYKHGYGVEKNISKAIVYLQEAINQKNDEVSMFNLAHIYFYGESVKIDLDKAIALLIRSSKKNFVHSKILLALVMIQKIQIISFEKIQHEINTDKLSVDIIQYIHAFQLENKKKYEVKYNEYKKYEFIYSMNKYPLHLKKIISRPQNNVSKEDCKKFKRNINDVFYEGFGITQKMISLDLMNVK